MNDEPASQLGEYIKSLRIQRHMTLRDVATEAGIDSGGLTRMEHGAVQHPRPDTLTALAQVLKVSPADMFVRAGYILPDELPGIESYLRAKYECLSRIERTELADIVEKLVRLHRQDIEAEK